MESKHRNKKQSPSGSTENNKRAGNVANRSQCPPVPYPQILKSHPHGPEKFCSSLILCCFYDLAFPLQCSDLHAVPAHRDGSPGVLQLYSQHWHWPCSGRWKSTWDWPLLQQPGISNPQSAQLQPCIYTGNGLKVKKWFRKLKSILT